MVMVSPTSFGARNRARAQRSGADLATRSHETGGNPFFAIEVLGASPSGRDLPGRER